MEKDTEVPIMKPTKYKGLTITFRKDKSGFVEIADVKGKCGKMMMREDKKRGGWHFYRKYGGKQHAVQVIKPVIDAYIKKGKCG
jgi:hypothetical protein